ncbi:response regulator [Actinomycetospora termitidis]|uniref:Response regulator transcription factor n=1 Tax=Actinomycetospora termitidis TaxID=3053470 RepID=A0ABT7M2L5_9PSEU|nr:response regulator transcription factor [Actinomycetospora sp. Odt1-22]MDL5154911.1 response regulator transcription factor [Actinomycetospora sp. Odt1-22]
MTDVRVLVVDDHPLYRSGLQAMVDRVEGIECAGAAASGEEALERITEVACDVVLLDLRMPGIGGLETCRRLLALPEAPAVVVLTMVEEDASVVAALRAGARGYLLKGADEAEILAALRLVTAGGTVLGPAVTPTSLARGADVDRAFPELTEQEQRVLELLAAGRPTAGIAAELSLSTKTVRNYLSATYAKLQVTDRYAAIARARERGLGR